MAQAPGPRTPLRDGIALDVIRVGYGGSTNTDIRIKVECDCAKPLPEENRTQYIPDGDKVLKFHPCRRCGGRIPVEQGV